MTSPALSLTLAAATGALALLEPQDWPRSVRVGYVVLPAAGLAGYTAYQMATAERPDSDDDAPTARSIALVSGGLGVAMAAVCAASFPVDRGIRNLVARTGTRYPRRWMAGGVVVLSLALDAIQARTE
ncbi:hypothetical protein [Kocuria sp.]|uniref:hypothetical protein n=1 Tax=Kocuria sp. TaxID=1871328 RepID=UPI0026DFB2E8|nr:hypothetical protein [Kocuria sp.]MDO5617981.1 hypothetical protein [Kocuria sp.]